MTNRETETAIKLNRAEHDYEIARARGDQDLRPYVGAVNDAARDFEYAHRDAIRQQVFGKVVRS